MNLGVVGQSMLRHHTLFGKVIVLVGLLMD